MEGTESYRPITLAWHQVGQFEKIKLHKTALEQEKAIKTLWLSGYLMARSADLHAGEGSRFAAVKD